MMEVFNEDGMELVSIHFVQKMWSGFASVCLHLIRSIDGIPSGPAAEVVLSSSVAVTMSSSVKEILLSDGAVVDCVDDVEAAVWEFVVLSGVGIGVVKTDWNC
jgi:hypothetical protein